MRHNRKTVCVESPLKGDLPKNLEYARQCLRYVLDKGHAPFASHLLYTQVLDDRVKWQRDKSLNAGIDFGRLCEERWFFTGLGMSEGMKLALNSANEVGQHIEIVHLEYGSIEYEPTPGAGALTPEIRQRLLECQSDPPPEDLYKRIYAALAR